MCKFANQVDNNETSWQYLGVFYGVMCVLGLSLDVFYILGLCFDYRSIFSGDTAWLPLNFGRIDVAVYFKEISATRRHLIVDKKEREFSLRYAFMPFIFADQVYIVWI